MSTLERSLDTLISSAMEQNAPPLEVLIAGSTYDLVRDMVDAEPVDPVTPKGGHEAHAAYRLVSVAARPKCKSSVGASSVRATASSSVRVSGSGSRPLFSIARSTAPPFQKVE